MALPLVEFCDLTLNFLHHLDLTLEEFSEGADSIVARLFKLPIIQWHLRLFDLVDESASDLFLGAWDDKVEELFIAHHRLVIVRHQVHQEGALLLRNVTLQSIWLQVAREEHEQGPIVDAYVVSSSLPWISRVLLNRTVHGHLLRPIRVRPRTLHDLLV